MIAPLSDRIRTTDTGRQHEQRQGMDVTNPPITTVANAAAPLRLLNLV